MRASIIIPAYNAEKTLPECLAACMAQEYPAFEVIVVDDGSRDRTAAIARQFQGVRVYTVPNSGPAAARNHGAAQATGDVFVYTDSDCVPDSAWLGNLLKSLDSGVVAVGGTYRCANPQSRLARVIQAEITHRHRQFRADVDFLGSFNVAYRAEAFHAAGGFDESYRQASGEDNDLAYRLLDAGGRLRFTPEATVAHYHPERLWSYLRTQARHGYWRMKLYRDHPRRAGGDQYAGLPDLLSPPLSLLALLIVPGLLAAGLLEQSQTWIPVLGAVVLATYVALHAPSVWTLRRDLGFTDLLYFGLVSILRDIARALGLVRGVVRFQCLGRRS